MDAWIWDLRHALRGLVRTPGFTLVAVVTHVADIAAWSQRSVTLRDGWMEDAASTEH